MYQMIFNVGLPHLYSVGQHSPSAGGCGSQWSESPSKGPSPIHDSTAHTALPCIQQQCSQGSSVSMAEPSAQKSPFCVQPYLCVELTSGVSAVVNSISTTGVGLIVVASSGVLGTACVVPGIINVSSSVKCLKYQDLFHFPTFISLTYYEEKCKMLYLPTCFH